MKKKLGFQIYYKMLEKNRSKKFNVVIQGQIPTPTKFEKLFFSVEHGIDTKIQEKDSTKESIRYMYDKNIAIKIPKLL